MDELQLVLRINSTPLAIITECWDIINGTGAIRGYLNFFNARCDRDDTRRGGGVGIYCREDLPYRQLNTPSDSYHETMWLWRKTRGLPRTYSFIILAAVYYPEGARNRRELVTFLQHQVDNFRKQFSNPAFIVAGDFNLTDKKWILHVLDLKQVVHVPTHESGSILDLILTNLEVFYEPPVSLEPLAKSDHNVLWWKPKSRNHIPKSKKVKTVYRPLSESSIQTFGRWIANFDFDSICIITNIDMKVETLYSILHHANAP